MPLPAIAAYLGEMAATWGLNQLISRMLPDDNSAYGKNVGQNLGYGEDLMSELYAESMGKPSAATKATYANVSDEINRLQQSYAASAQRSTPGMKSMSTPVRAGQGRLQETKVRAYADILGNAQQNAQRLVMGQYGTAQAGQLALEMQNRQDADSLSTMLSGIINGYKQAKLNSEGQGIFGGLIKRLYAMLSGEIFPTQSQVQVQGGPLNPPYLDPYASSKTGWVT